MQINNEAPVRRLRARGAHEMVKNGAMAKEFQAWMESGVLPQSLVAWMGVESEQPLGAWARDVSLSLRDPKLLLARLESWIVAERSRQEQGGAIFHGVKVDELGGRRDPMLSAAIFSSENGSIADLFAKRICSKIAQNGGDSEDWSAFADSILSAAIDLQGLAVGVSSCGPDWRSNAINRGLAESVAGCGGLRQGWPAPSVVQAWISLGANPNAESGIGRDPKNTPVQMCLRNPACWRQLLPLVKAGGAIPPASVVDARRMVSAMLADPMRAEFGEKAAGALAILQASGDSLESFRSKRGERFDVFALGAIWNNPSSDMARELAALGARWSPLAMVRAAQSLARHLQTGRHPQAMIDAMDAAMESADPGSFNKAWLDVAASARKFTLRWGGVNENSWGEKFAAWGRRLGWSSSEISILADSWPGLGKAPAMIAVIEAAQIADLTAERANVAAKKRISL